jgi:glycine hydroxymethyltransferase
MAKSRSTGISHIVERHERWRGACLNLIPSENITSPKVREILASDLGHRYTLPFNKEIDGAFIENAYRGTRYTDEAQAAAERLACQVFGSRHSYVNALSGHIAAVTVLLSVCKRRDLIMAPGLEVGGYHGWVGPWLPDAFGLRFSKLPFKMKDWDIDQERACKAIRRKRPRLVVLGLSYFPFPFDIGPVREACDDAGSVLAYDASHVLGLVAGGRFQRPLKEGVDVMLGSTHKSFFGPQGGLVLTDRDDLDAAIRENTTWRTIDNAHWNRVAALGRALEEMRRYGKAYAGQVVRNSKALAKALTDEGAPLRFGHRGFTESHQVMMDAKRATRMYGASFNDLSKMLEAENIIVDSVARIGTSEVTRLGLREKDMGTVASFIIAVLRDGERVGPKVRAFRKGLKIAYC